ncbi:MAG: LicD family protein [Clostridiales bacterium]|nr:LicD family protein [Clostridiales bacterium]
MTEMQAKLFDMLKWFDAFCRQNELSYYAVGGTLLGAVRHNGFIPWDDDIDVAMPRDDYDKLITLMKGKTFGKYVLESYDSENDDYCYPYNKIYDISTTLIENYRKPLKRGIFLDVFPLDGAGNNELDSIKWCKHINRRYYFFLTRIAAVRKERSLYKNVAIVLSNIIPHVFVNNFKLRIKLDSMCRRYNPRDSLYVGNLLGNWGTKEIIKSSIIGNPTEYDFEGAKIFGIEHFDEYLSHIYGDWRSLPPEEKRQSHHDYLFLDLNNSYRK